MFASANDIKVRLGRELTASEEAKANQLLEGATSLIAEAVGKDDEWAEGYDPIPKALKELTVTVVLRGFSNPDGLVSSDRRLGQYEIREQFATTTGSANPTSLLLSESEQRLARRIIRGYDSATARVPSIIDELPQWEDNTRFLLPSPSDDGESSD